MNLSFASLFFSFTFGVIGLTLLKKGRAEGRIPFTGIGLLLMIYPWFVSDAGLGWIIGIGLCSLAWALRNR